MKWSNSGSSQLTLGLHVRLAYMHLSSAGVTLYTAFPEEAKKLRDNRVKVNDKSFDHSVSRHCNWPRVLNNSPKTITMLYNKYLLHCSRTQSSFKGYMAVTAQ